MTGSSSLTLAITAALACPGVIECSSSDSILKQDPSARSQQAAMVPDGGTAGTAGAGASGITDAGVGAMNDAGATAAELARIQAYLDSRYTAKDVWRTFETKLGQTIDCIDWFAQPSVRELAAAGTPITEIPSPVKLPNGMAPTPTSMPDWGFNGAPDKNGAPRACPLKSTPFVRVTVAEILAAGGLDAYLQTYSSHSAPDDNEYSPTYAHDRVRFDHGGSSAQIYYGVAWLSIQTPSIPYFTQRFLANTLDHNISQLWMTSGNADYDSACPSNTPYRDRTSHNCTSTNWMQTVETGWQITGPFQTNAEFFIYSTKDGYSHGCHAGQPICDGGSPTQPFFQNQGNIWPVPGTPGSYLPTNLPGPSWQEWELPGVSIYNNGDGKWHVIVNSVDIGYYGQTPWFTGTMQTTAQEFRTGGEVEDSTKMWIVPMGSGASASAGLGQAAYIHDFYACANNGIGCVPDMSPMDVINGGTGQYQVYDHSTNKPPGVSWANAFFFGNVPGVFWGQNYGYQWSPTNPQDWAWSYYKGECGYMSFPQQGTLGIPMTGLSSNAMTNPLHFAHAVLCNSRPVETTGSQCQTIQDEMDCNLNGDWDPSGFKAECGCGEYVMGISQAGAGINTILCCPGQYMNTQNMMVNLSQANCNYQEFYSGDSTAYLPNTPDWDPYHYKGQCAAGRYVAGVSFGTSGTAWVPRRLLCCDMPNYK